MALFSIWHGAGSPGAPLTPTTKLEKDPALFGYYRQISGITGCLKVYDYVLDLVIFDLMHQRHLLALLTLLLSDWRQHFDWKMLGSTETMLFTFVSFAPCRAPSSFPS